MFSVTRTDETRLEIEWSGLLDADDMRAFLDELVAKSMAIESGTMLYRIGQFDMPTMGALGVELARLPEMFRLIAKFERAAVLCDENWVRRVSEWEGKLIPGLEIKAFPCDAETEAAAWLDQR